MEGAKERKNTHVIDLLVGEFAVVLQHVEIGEFGIDDFRGLGDLHGYGQEVLKGLFIEVGQLGAVGLGDDELGEN